MPPKPKQTVPATPAQGGPYLQSALICEKVLRDADGVQSYIRVVDRITVTTTGEDPPPEMPPQHLDLTASITLKAGEARGRYAVKFRPEAPGGFERPALEVPVNFVGEGEHGNTVNVELKGLEIDLEGLWWFDVLFVDRHQKEKLMTRIPLRMMYQPQRVIATGQADEPSES